MSTSTVIPTPAPPALSPPAPSSGRLGRLFAAGALALGLALVAVPGLAQTTTLGSGDSGDAPIEVTSDNGIEWRRDENLYIARGNAQAVQGTDQVFGDVLVAHYRETPKGGTQIWRMEARGNARIVTPDQTVTGGVAVYEVEKKLLVVRGAPLRMETPTEVVTASDSLEYWGTERMSVARGDAMATRANGDVVTADVLTGYFANATTGSEPPETAETTETTQTSETTQTETDSGPMGSTGDLERMEAFGSVVITTPKEVVRGDRAVYDVAAGVATVVGNVTISTETDQFAGDRAVMNLNTGVSTLQGGGDGRARALIAPSRPEGAADDAGSN